MKKGIKIHGKEQRSTHEQIKESTIKTEEQQPRLILQKTRSLRGLLGQLSPRGKVKDSQLKEKKINSRKNHGQAHASGKPHENNPWNQKKNIAEHNEYLVAFQREQREEVKIIRSPKHLKQNILHLKQVKPTKQGQLPEKLGSKRRESLYNPDNYNWRKSLSKDKEEIRSFRGSQSRGDLRFSHHEYFPSKNTSKNNETKETPSRKEVNESKKEKAKSLTNRYKGRNSPLVKPKILKSIFEGRENRGHVKSSKSLLFTFGL